MKNYKILIWLYRIKQKIRVLMKITKRLIQGILKHFLGLSI